MLPGGLSLPLTLWMLFIYWSGQGLKWIWRHAPILLLIGLMITSAMVSEPRLLGVSQTTGLIAYGIALGITFTYLGWTIFKKK